MSKKILILSGSPRNYGNSDILCNEFIRGAIESGNDVQKFRVAEKNIGFCRTCYACRDTGVCVIKDDMAEVMQKIIDADVLDSSVYFYSIDSQLKALIDGTVARWTKVKNNEFYYIVTAVDGEKEAAVTTVACFRGYADCVNGAKEMGIIYGMGIYEKGKVKEDTNAMLEAYEMDKGYETSANYTLVFYTLTVKHMPISVWYGSDKFRHILTENPRNIAVSRVYCFL